MRAMVLALAAVLVGGCSSDESAAPDEARAQARLLARDDIACTTDADCCVVFDTCRNEGYVVSAGDREKAASFLGAAVKDTCNRCITPSIQVYCGPQGVCTGAVVECAGIPWDEGAADHCGKLAAPAGCAEKKPAAATPSGPGLQPEMIIGCGT